MSLKYTSCFFCLDTIEDSSQNSSSNKIFQVNNQQVNCLKQLLTHLTSDNLSNEYPRSKLNDILKLWISCSYLLEASGDIYIARLCMDCNNKVQKFMKLQLQLDFFRKKSNILVKNMQGLIVSSKLKSLRSTDQSIGEALQEFQEAVCCSVNTTNLKANSIDALDTQPEVPPVKLSVINNPDEPEHLVSHPNSPNVSTPDDTQDQIVSVSDSVLDDDDDETCDLAEPTRIMIRVNAPQNIEPVKPIIMRRYCCGPCEDEKGNHKSFDTESELRQHIEDQHRPKSFKCQVCGVSFCKGYILRAHQRIHTGNGFKCGTCGKVFAHRIHCVNHEKYTHSEERALVCKICGKTFRHPRSLSEHKLVHTNERHFECDICKRKFKSKKVLVNHLRAHAGERKFPCKICGFRLTTKASRERHLKIKHPEIAISK